MHTPSSSFGNQPNRVDDQREVRDVNEALIAMLVRQHELIEEADLARRKAEALAEKLRESEGRLRESDRRKSEFLAMLAHELRNPLAPIRNAVHVLRISGGAGEDFQSATEMMERYVDHMVRLVDDLLDVSRISRGKIELRKSRVEVASIVNQATEAIRPIAESLGLELRVTLPPDRIYLDADSTRLVQVMGNLLTNACKFTDKGGHISLSVDVTRSAKSAVDKVVVRVRDSGIGISPEKLPHVFDMFMQIDTSLERSVSGLGIGLTLVKELVEKHCGTVEIHSDGIGHGTECTVRLPIMAEVAVSSPPQQLKSAPKPTISYRILVVDDNRDAAKSLAMLLKLKKNDTRTAHDGVEAVEATEIFRPDVILLDIGLPKLNGYEVCRRIREQPWGRNIFLVALTGWGQEEDRQKSKEAGFDDHLVKPVDLAALTQLLAGLPQI